MHRILIYLACLAVISAPFWWLSRSVGFNYYTVALMFAPCFAALATLRLTGGDYGQLGWRGSHWRWVALSWLVTVAVIGVASFATVLLGAAGFPNLEYAAERAERLGMPGAPTAVVVGVYALLAFTAGIVGLSANALGEEVGWRGFLTPETYTKWGFTGSSLFVGSVWALWHFPLLWGRMSLEATFAFTVMVIAASFAYTWFRLASRSVWPAVIMHGTHNAAFLAFWDNFLIPGQNDRWTGEAGYAVAIAYVLLAACCWVLRARAEALWQGAGGQQ